MPLSVEETKTLAIIRMITSSVSFIASCMIVLLIARSTKKLTTTQNRLLFGLSSSDILASFAMAFVSFPMPKETMHAWMPSGNVQTCQVQGFMVVTFALLTPSYNAALSIYYLLKVRYRITDETITRRVEPFLHAIPIIIASSFPIYALSRNYVNPADGICQISDFPRGCTIHPKLTCLRGENFQEDPYVKFNVFYLTIVLPIIIIGNMLIIFFTVRNQEMRMARFGRGALNIPGEGGCTGTSSSRSRNMKMTMYRAIAYTAAWFLAYAPLTYQALQQVFAKKGASYFLAICNGICYPLQGFFNFLVFIYPKVLLARQMDPELSMCGAIGSALKINISLPTFRWRRRRSHNSMIVRSMDDVCDEEGKGNDDVAASEEAVEASTNDKEKKSISTKESVAMDSTEGDVI